MLSTSDIIELLRRDGVSPSSSSSFSLELSLKKLNHGRQFSHPLITHLLRFGPSQRKIQGNRAQTIRDSLRFYHSFVKKWVVLSGKALRKALATKHPRLEESRSLAATALESSLWSLSRRKFVNERNLIERVEDVRSQKK